MDCVQIVLKTMTFFLLAIFTAGPSYADELSKASKEFKKESPSNSFKECNDAFSWESLHARASFEDEKVANSFKLNFDDDQSSQSCCKICSKGKACGNSCISRSKTCHKPPGCACDG